MRKIILASVAVLAFASLANAASTLAVAGGGAVSHVGTGAAAAATGPAVAGALNFGTNTSVAAGFAVATPAGGLSTGVGGSAGNANGISGVVAGPGGTGVAGTLTNATGFGVGGGLTNVTP